MKTTIHAGSIRTSAVRITVLILLLCTGILTGQSSQTEAKAKYIWNKSKEYSVKSGAFRFSAYLSDDKKQSWIYQVEPTKSGATPKQLIFPQKVNGAKVTRIGNVLYEGDPSISAEELEDEEFNENIFGTTVELAHECDGYTQCISKVTKIKLPNSVTKIDATSFSGMRALKEVKLPKKLKTLESEVFYGCDNLKKVTFSTKLKSFEKWTSFADCDNLKQIIVPKGNKTFKVTAGMLLTNKSKSLYWVAPHKTVIQIPNQVTTVTTGALSGSQAEKLVIPKNVKCLEKYSINGTFLRNVQIAAENPAYCRDGQCIYRKSDRSLILGIAKNRSLKVSDQVQIITEDASLCGADSLDVFDLPASVKRLEGYWGAVFNVSTRGKMYFRGITPPEIVCEGADASVYAAFIPIFCDVYVPKDALNIYKDWYTKWNRPDFVSWFTF